MPQAATSGRVLLVDDDEDTRNLLRESLQRCGLHVEAVESAQACLARVGAAPFEIVVTDVEMPGMSGVELCGALHDRSPSVVSIVLTGLGDAKTAAAAFANGAVEVLVKPIAGATLHAAIMRALAHKTA